MAERHENNILKTDSTRAVPSGPGIPTKRSICLTSRYPSPFSLCTSIQLVFKSLYEASFWMTAMSQLFELECQKQRE